MQNDSRFWLKVKRGDGCWLWAAATLRSGYGAFRRDSAVMVRAHRHAWELTNGVVPAGLHVLHRCDVRSCCRPDHLFLGSHANNMRDMSVKGRNGRMPDRRGEKNPASRLKRADVEEIRAEVANGKRGIQHALAIRFKVSDSLIHRIVNGLAWA